MAKMITDGFCFTLGDKQFKIWLTSPIVAINGDSGIGKSFLFDAIQQKVFARKLKNIICIDYTNYELVLEPALKSKGNLIIIDNADAILTEGDWAERNWGAEFEADANNQYLLFTRYGGRYHVKMEDDSTLQYCEGTFRNVYPWRELKEKGVIR